MKGYGWCVRKENYLNVGLGRLDPHGLPSHVAGLLDFLKRTGKVVFDVPSSLFGHAYLLYGHSKRNVADEGILLIGDAAGLAYSQSGEGIRPAIESGLLGAKAILAAGGSQGSRLEEEYRGLLAQRFEKPQREWAFQLGRRLPAWLMRSLARLLFATGWFSRRIVLERWFLHCEEPAMNP
jgi:flavin-dependent dehydrogenase